MAAILEDIELQRAEIAAIADNPEPATFANTLVALQMAGEPPGRCMTLFWVMTGNVGTPDCQAVERESYPSSPRRTTRSPSTRSCSSASGPWQTALPRRA